MAKRGQIGRTADLDDRGLALFVLLEKTVPAGPRVGRITGLVLIAWGIGMLAMVA
jgi:predicted metal-binding membrane protein